MYPAELIAVEESRRYREAIGHIRARIAAQQLGEAFMSERQPPHGESGLTRLPANFKKGHTMTLGELRALVASEPIENDNREVKIWLPGSTISLILNGTMIARGPSVLMIEGNIDSGSALTLAPSRPRT